MTNCADYPPELTRALRHLRNWEGDPETYRSITLLLAAFDDRDMKLSEGRTLHAGETVDVVIDGTRLSAEVKHFGNSGGELVVVVDRWRARD